MTLQEKADRIFSVFIRVSYADFDGYEECFTCGVKKQWKEMQCGHWLRRWYGATRYHEDNCRPQCMTCNEHRGGMEDAFEEGLRTDLCDERVDALLDLAQRNEQYSDTDYQAVIDKYRLLLRDEYSIIL